MAFQVDKVDRGDEADGLAIPLVEILDGRHAVEDLVANHLRPHGHRLPPHLVPITTTGHCMILAGRKINQQITLHFTFLQKFTLPSEEGNIMDQNVGI